MALTTTAADIAAFMEVAYTPNTVKSLALKDNPLTTFLPKRQSGGLNVTTRLLFAEAGGQGVTLTAAIAAERDAATKQVIFGWKKFYTSHSIDNDSIEQSEKNAVISSLRLATDSTLRRHGDQLESVLWATESGSIGRIATGGVSSNTLTLTNPGDVFNFEVGDVVVLDDTATGASLRSGTAVVNSIDYENGKIVLDDASDPAAAAGDYIFLSGFQNNGGPQSIRSWLPNSVAASGDAFGTGSLDRYPYGARAAGWKYTAPAGMTNKEAIIRGLSFGKQFKGRPDVVFGSTNRVASLVVELANNAQYDAMKDEKLKLNFRGVSLKGPQGDVLVLEAPKCPDDRFFALQRDTWVLHTIGDLIRNPVHNGKFIDSESEDGIRMRWKTTYSLSCEMPGYNGQIIFA